MVVLTAGAKLGTAATTPGTALLGPAEQGFEEVAEILTFARLAAAAEFETRIPPRRRAEILARPEALPDLVIGSAFFGILQDLVSFGNFLEAGFGTLILVDVGIILARELAIGGLDVISRGGAFDAQNSCSSPYTPSGGSVAVPRHIRPRSMPWPR